MFKRQLKHVTLFSAVAAVFYSTAVFAQSNTLCVFLQKIVPTTQDEFVDWKGAQRPASEDKTLTTYTGTLIPGVGTSCTLSVRRLSGTDILPPLYLCSLSENQDSAQAASIYNSTARDLRSCYSGWAFTEERGSNGSPEVQTLTAKTSGIEVRVLLEDISFVVQRPYFTVTLELYDDFPAANGNATIPRVY